jgi:hypothetical protein
MGLFRRRRETANEILLREAHLDQPSPAAGTASAGDELEQPPAPFDPYAGTYPADTFWGRRRAMPRPEHSDLSTAVTIPGLPGADYVVEAERLDGDFWEVRAAPL